MEDVNNQRIAVVTGASSGFGRRTAELLAADGWRVYATLRESDGRNAAAARALADQNITVVELDVTSDASVDVAARRIIGEAGAPDLLVNNAGTGFFGIQEAFSVEAAERQFATNVFGVLRVNRAFLPAMRERRSGLVVYVSSIVGRLIFPFSGIYQSSKWALEALAETAAYELTPFGIDTAIVQPGAYPTEIFGKQVLPDDTVRAESYGEQHAALFAALGEGLGAAAQGRDPGDVGRAIVTLAAMPPGSRPLRTTVPEDAATDEINAAVEAVQRRTLEAFGFGAMLPGTRVAV